MIQIIVPNYNPEKDWEKVLFQAFQAFEQQLGQSAGLILVDDGSAEKPKAESIQFLKNQIENFQYFEYDVNRGKGYALRYGVEKATAETLILTDNDFPFTTQSMIDIYLSLESGNDVAVGYRDAQYYENVPWFRKIISRFFRWCLKKTFSLPTDDTQCGLKGFKISSKQTFLDTNIDRFLFDLEFLVAVSKNKDLKLSTVVVELNENVVFSKISWFALLQELFNFIKVYLRS